MNTEALIEAVAKEIKSTVNTIDPSFDIGACMILYFKALKHTVSYNTVEDLEGLEKNIEHALSTVFIEEKIDRIMIGTFCKNFEPFAKKIYYVLLDGGLIKNSNQLDPKKEHALMPFLTAFNKIRQIFIDDENNEVYEVELAAIRNNEPVIKINKDTGLEMYKRLFPRDIQFDKYSKLTDEELEEKFQDSFLLYLIKAVKLKNEQSHQVPHGSISTNVENLSSTLLAELWMVDFFKKELTKTFRKASYKLNNFNEYFDEERKRLKKQRSKFVSLSLKELAKGNAESRTGFIEDLLSNNLSRMRVLGMGGAGKTTTLEYLFCCDIDRCVASTSRSKIPVLIYLAGLSRRETIVERIAKKLHVELEYLEELLKTNMLKLYLDGINEIVGSAQVKTTVLKEIGSILEEYPKLNIVITDRFEYDIYQSNMFPIPTFTIQKLSEDQIEEFVEKYCNNNKEQVSNVLKVLKSKEKIQDILARPLVLTRAIEIIKTENDLPEKEGQIIEKFIDGLLKREKDDKMDPMLNIRSFKLLLSYAADKIMSKFRSNAPVSEHHFNKLLVEAAVKFGLETSNAGYISRIGYELEILSKENGYIKFHHQSYLEFFVTHYLRYEDYLND